MNQIKVNRDLQDGHYNLEDIFENLKSVEILLKVFKSKDDLDDVFEKTVVIVDGSSHYMHVKNEDASIVVGKDHLKNSEKKNSLS